MCLVTEDKICSLGINQRLLGTTEIILIHHTDCGMLTFTDDAFKKSIRAETGCASGSVSPRWQVIPPGRLQQPRSRSAQGEESEKGRAPAECSRLRPRARYGRKSQ